MAQPSIMNFFKKSTSKRNTEDEDKCSQSKRRKTEELQSDVLMTVETLGSLHPTLSNIGATWFHALESEFKKDYFQKLSTFLKVERKNNTIYPPTHQVFTWTQTCKIDDIKVV